MRYIVGFLVTIGLIILIIVLLLRGGGGSVTTKQVKLGDYLYSGGTAQLIIDGPIVADPNHREVQINVSQNSVDFTLYQGYQQTVVRSQTYPNNQSAYAVFLQALQHAGYTLTTNDKSLYDERGYCPGGDRFIYAFTNNGTNVVRSWSTSCGGTSTFRGVPGTVLTLFKRQVPNYGDLIKDTNLNF
jgi:hypothetical protein